MDDEHASSGGEDLRAGLSTPQVCAIVGVPLSTLDYWIRTGLVAPTLVPSRGRRATRWWSVTDVVVVRAVKALRQAGCPLQRLREAKALIEGAWDQTFASVVLYWDGSDVLAIEQWGTVRSAVKHPGQQMFHLVALPVDSWRREIEAVAVEVNVVELTARSRASRGQIRIPTASINLSSPMKGAS